MGSPLRGVEEPRDGPAIDWLFRRGQLLLGILLVALVAGSYWVKTRPAPASPLEATQAAQMKAGLDALGHDDPRAAAEHFRKVLALYPSHYGATFQLATALDRAGRGGDARPYWEKMLPLAEATNDEQTLAAVRARLRRRDVPSEGDLMRVGLDALYGRRDPDAAAVEFQKVLEQNPTHYGATFQLATALDRAGKPAEARPLWERVVEMAEGYDDRKTAEAARARLAKPGGGAGAGTEEALMKAGLDALYGQKDPSAAAMRFRKVLELRPSHYGATFQLAMALDRAGMPGEARPLWETVVKMAAAYKDKDTLDHARARLARTP